MVKKDTSGLMTKTEIARWLSEKTSQTITGAQVWAWYDRRINNGFPEPKKVEQCGSVARAYFDPNEVLDWHEEYVPLKGGRPWVRTPPWAAA